MKAVLELIIGVALSILVIGTIYIILKSRKTYKELDGKEYIDVKNLEIYAVSDYIRDEKLRLVGADIRYAFDRIKNNPSPEGLLLTPIETVLEYVEIVELIFNDNQELVEGETKITIENVEASQPLFINTFIPCGMPAEKIVWKTSEGLIGEYVIEEPGFSSSDKNKSVHRYILTADIKNEYICKTTIKGVKDRLFDLF